MTAKEKKDELIRLNGLIEELYANRQWAEQDVENAEEELDDARKKLSSIDDKIDEFEETLHELEETEPEPDEYYNNEYIENPNQLKLFENEKRKNALGEKD